jgi:hypothetical protein
MAPYQASMAQERAFMAQASMVLEQSSKATE